MTSAEISQSFQSKFPQAQKFEFRDETTFLIDASQIHEACLLCRDALSFDFLLDVISVDHFGEEPRFEVVYELYSLKFGAHLRLKAKVSEDDLEVPSVVDVWPTANWLEREVFDMMGIRFKNHPDLRRILMWGGYPYYPLRKDFPLEGKPTDMPDIAFSNPAPLEGGPFVTSSSTGTTKDREPHARPAEIDPKVKPAIEPNKPPVEKP